MAGWFGKKGEGRLAKPKRRFLELRGTQVQYYAGEAHGRGVDLKGEFYLKPNTTVTVEGKNLAINTMARVWEFTAEPGTDPELWRLACEATIEDVKSRLFTSEERAAILQRAADGEITEKQAKVEIAAREKETIELTQGQAQRAKKRSSILGTIKKAASRASPRTERRAMAGAPLPEEPPGSPTSPLPPSPDGGPDDDDDADEAPVMNIPPVPTMTADELGPPPPRPPPPRPAA